MPVCNAPIFVFVIIIGRESKLTCNTFSFLLRERPFSLLRENTLTSSVDKLGNMAQLNQLRSLTGTQFGMEIYPALSYQKPAILQSHSAALMGISVYTGGSECGVDARSHDVLVCERARGPYLRYGTLRYIPTP